MTHSEPWRERSETTAYAADDSQSSSRVSRRKLLFLGVFALLHIPLYAWLRRRNHKGSISFDIRGPFLPRQYAKSDSLFKGELIRSGRQKHKVALRDEGIAQVESVHTNAMGSELNVMVVFTFAGDPSNRSVTLSVDILDAADATIARNTRICRDARKAANDLYFEMFNRPLQKNFESCNFDGLDRHVPVEKLRVTITEYT